MRNAVAHDSLNAASMTRTSKIRAILAGGLVAGTFDILYATIFSAFRGVAPMRILQSVASGALGAAAFNGGVTTACLGLLLHYVIAIIIGAIFVAAASRLSLLNARPVLSGAIYGFIVYWVMNLVVLPLSAFPRKVVFVPIVVITGLAVHMFLIGVPIALIARRASSSRESKNSKAGAV